MATDYAPISIRSNAVGLAGPLALPVIKAGDIIDVSYKHPVYGSHNRQHFSGRVVSVNVDRKYVVIHDFRDDKRLMLAVNGPRKANPTTITFVSAS